MFVVLSDKVEASFWRMYDKQPDGCWLWTGRVCRSRPGCGSYRLPAPTYRQAVVEAHTVAYMLTNGPISEGLEVLQSCKMPLCGNPDHLYLGTPEPLITHPRIKLDVVAVRHIRKQCAQGIAQKLMAAHFGISATSVSLIVRGERWNGKGGHNSA